VELAGRGDLLGGRGQARQRSRPRARDEQTQPDGRAGAAEHDGEQDPAQAGERRVGLGQRARDLQGLAVGAASRQHPQVDAVDGLVAQTLLESAPQDRAHVGRAGQLRALDRPDDVAVGQGRLRDAGGRAERRRRDRHARAGAVEPRQRGAGPPVADEDDLGLGAAQRPVDRGPQVVADDDVGDDRRQRDGRRDGGGGERDDAPPERHGRGARRTYPTPRTVCSSRGSPRASVLRRR
jgi:hypothetical protein